MRHQSRQSLSSDRLLAQVSRQSEHQTGNGDISESAVWLFDHERLQLIAALIETRLNASYLRSKSGRR